MMYCRFRLVAALLLVLGSLMPARAATADIGAMQFISSLGDQALQVVRGNMAPSEKLTYFHETLNRDFDMPEISRFVLGPYWRVATPFQHQEFIRLLSDDLVRFYRGHFTRYEGETFRVTGSRPDPAGTIVTSEILRPNGAPIEVDWQLRAQGGLYKISDVIIDGVSMALSERETFARQIRATGGQVGVLLARMQQEDRGLLGSP
ncbi:MAG TPA: ABC transporter substrate-binding protein [Stellaceae bacterium]|nr:ABC transporter substrate-binding protein [Stellaceae bacterium]